LTSNGIKFLQQLLALYDTLSLDEAFKSALEILAHAVPCDLLDWYEMESLRRTCRLKLSQQWIKKARRNRSLPAARGQPKRGGGRDCPMDDAHIACRISDYIPSESAKEHPLYELLSGEPITRHGLLVRLEIPSMGAIVVSLKRKHRDFSDEDMAAAEAVARLLARPLAEKAPADLSPERCAERIAQALCISRREAEIAYWIFMGKHNKEIAQILGVSPHTVRTHVQNIFRKQMVSSRFDLAHAILRTLSDFPMPAAAPKKNAVFLDADKKGHSQRNGLRR